MNRGIVTKNIKRAMATAAGTLALVGLSASPSSAATYNGPSGCAVYTSYDYSVGKYEWSAQCKGRASKKWRVTVTFEYPSSPGVYQNYTVPWTDMGGVRMGAAANARVVSAFNWSFK